MKLGLPRSRSVGWSMKTSTMFGNVESLVRGNPAFCLFQKPEFKHYLMRSTLLVGWGFSLIKTSESFGEDNVVFYFDVYS